MLFSTVLLCVLVTITTVGGVYNGTDQGHTTVPHSQINSNETNIDLSRNNISTLIDNEFSAYTSLQILTMNEAGVMSISHLAFEHTQLTELYLDGNLLTDCPDMTVVAGSLWVLSLQDNNISSIPNALLAPLTNVGKLLLTNNPLSAWPDVTGLGSVKPDSTIVVNGIYTLPLDIPPSYCSISVLEWNEGTDGFPTITCPNDDSTRLDTICLDKHNLNDSTDFTGIISLAEAGRPQTLEMRENLFTEFPTLPMVVRGVLSTLQLCKNPLKTIPDDGRLDGYDMLLELRLCNTHIVEFPCKIFNMAKTVTLYGTRSLSMDADLWMGCLCDRASLRMESLNMGRTAHRLGQLPDLSHVLCMDTTPLDIGMINIAAPCDCSTIWLADLYKCGVKVRSKVPCGLSTWQEVKAYLKCPNDFALVYTGTSFTGTSTLLTGAASLSSAQSLIIRGSYTWKMKGSLERTLSPGAYEDLSIVMASPSSIEPVAVTGSKYSVTLLPPVSAYPTSLGCTQLILAPGVLEDDPGDSTCYTVKDSIQHFQLTHEQPESVGYVEVLTRSMDCQNPFHVQVYVSAAEGCMPVLCPLVIGNDEGEMLTRCQYACGCSTGQCLRDGQWYLRVAYPYTGHLCGVRIVT